MEVINREIPLVALVGRPNVGKSTLFNRLASQRISIVESIPGVTRDRIYAPASWRGRDFILVDTGGITDSRDSLDKQVTNQALLAATEADVVLFLVDARDGLLPMDRGIALSLRRHKKPVLLVANKCEAGMEAAVDFYDLGLGETLAISAEHGLGIGEVLDQVVFNLPPVQPSEVPTGISIAVIGRPNVGKSTLVNALLGAERVITSDLPGTTRDAIDTELIHENKHFTLIDTAGIRRAAKIEEPVEYYGVLRAIRAVERADLVLLVLDAADPATIQDQRIAGIAREAGKACLILVNKWDLRRAEEIDREQTEEKVKEALDFLRYAPIEFVSAKTGYGLTKIMPLVEEIAAEYSRQIPTARLNKVLNDAVLLHEPPSYKGRKLRLFYAAQVKTKPPLIAIQVNDPGLVHFSYERYLENRLREAFSLKGCPLLLRFRPRSGRNRS